MAVEISDGMLLMGWAIASWAIGVLSALMVLYCCHGGSENMVKTQAAPVQTDIPPPPDSDDSDDGGIRRRKPIPFDQVYLTNNQKYFIHMLAAHVKADTLKVLRQ